jgi:Uri superfamily endonuclease
MKINQIIEKAIEGGYAQEVGKRVIKEGSKDENSDIYFILLDPLFWQSLGKALGWGIEKDDVQWHLPEKWKQEWHWFIDHLIEGKSIESFFEEF